jgi:hypothetical protein
MKTMHSDCPATLPPFCYHVNDIAETCVNIDDAQRREMFISAIIELCRANGTSIISKIQALIPETIPEWR